MPKFPNKKIVNEANEWLKSEKIDNDASLIKIFNDKNDFGKEPSSEELNKLTTSRDLTRNAIQSNEANISKHTVQLKNIKNEIERISLSLSTVDGAELDTKVAIATKGIETSTSNITEMYRVQEQRSRKNIGTKSLKKKNNVWKND